MLKYDIFSEDRIGITQEILAVFGAQGWDLLAMEMQPHHTYVSCNAPETKAELIVAKLMEVKGVNGVHAIPLLPSEHRRDHLDALLSHLPDAILDIDSQGKIMVANQAAQRALALSPEAIQDNYLNNIIEIELDHLLHSRGFSREINTPSGSFLLQSSPVKSGKLVTGAVIVLRSPESLGQQMSAVQSDLQAGIESIVGQSSRVRSIKQQTLRFASLELPVLITGETGTGKELFAKALHHEGNRKLAPFLTINCAALPENLLESELFGYAPGAFSGAHKGGKPGLFELANSGTVFLDEIGEMSMYLQAKLLRFLEDLTFRRIGGTREISVDVRIVCATHRNLEAMTYEKTFREDLFYRLNVLSLHLPPLREREGDLDLLVPYFLKRASEQVRTSAISLSDHAYEQIKQHSWPGNVRQLQNTLFRAVALCESDTIDSLDSLQDRKVAPQRTDHKPSFQIESEDEISTLQKALSEYEDHILRTFYPDFPSSRKLANRLGLSHAQMARKLAKHGIS